MADWTIERVRALSTVDIRALQGNAVRLKNEKITLTCTEALAETGKTLRPRPSGASPFHDSAVAAVAAALEATVPETEEQFSSSLRTAISQVAGRMAISSRLTLADLWYKYTVAAFSSQAESYKGTAAHLFAASKNPCTALGLANSWRRRGRRPDSGTVRGVCEAVQGRQGAHSVSSRRKLFRYHLPLEGFARRRILLTSDIPFRNLQ